MRNTLIFTGLCRAAAEWNMQLNVSSLGAMSNRSGNKRRRSRLRERIEKIRSGRSGEGAERAAQRRDDELLSYVSAFVEDVARIPRLEPFSLLTPESARAAVDMLKDQQNSLDSYLRRA